MAPASGKHRTTSWPSSSGLCHYFMTHSRCKFGSSCKYSHDVSSGRRNGPHSSQRASTLTSSAEAIDSERHNFQAWRRLRPMPMYPEDDDTSKFFSMGLEITEVDASLAQEVVREMASDGRLRIIREVVERLSTSDTPGNKAILWQSRICPLFRTIIHPSIVDSVVVEQEMAIVYRSLLGVDATRLSCIYSFILHLVDHWSEIPFAASDVPAMEALALSSGVLAKVIDTSTSNIVSDQFVSLAKEIQLRLDVFGNDNDTFHTIQASKYLDYVRRRLGIGQSLPEASRTATSTGAMAEFILDQDLPGALSRRGRRHDNDHSSIVDIKLMPTHEEIMSTRDEYLPTMNSSQHHLQGLPGLLDRHFRLLREDTLHELRNAVRASIETNDKVREVRTRIVVYDYAMAADVAFSQRTGLEFVVGFDQPRAAKDLDKLERAAWWTQHKRLTDGTLTCVIDEFGDVHFFQVSRSTVRTPRAPNQHNEDTDEENESRYSLPGDQQRAFVYLKLVDTGEDEVARALLWFKNRSSGKQQRLFEFPSVLLPAFTPPLKALQNMSQKLDLPFQDLLTLDNKSQPREITPPLYSLRPGFSFDLSCLSKDDTRLSYTPGGVMDPAAIQRHTTLDLTQSEAILASLSRSLALIQGPPGTGKSYTGEALIKVLLANKEKAKLGPIMCVCYTNHALDQLLEHLVDGGVQNIVRIGSRSKSERLEPVNLREVVSNMTRSRTEGRALWESIEELKSETEYVQTKLSTYRYLDTNKKIRAFLAEHHRSHHDELFGLDNEDSEDDEGWIEVRRKGRKNPLELWLRGGPASNAPTRSLRHLFRARLSQMAPNERVLLHQEWLRQVLQDDLEMLCEAHERYDESREKTRRIRSSIDLRCLQQANIIGITTTGLATNLDLLRRVKGKVLLCEEAGEVLESHLLTALLPTIEHAILIGDHLQLRPQIQDWRLQRANPAGVKYSLDVSLFERLVHPPIPGTPRLPFSVLNTQRRMHPSIAELIRSTLYPSLVDFESVEEYPDVPGLAKRLFWLHHETPESGRTSDKDSIDTSYSNDFEVEMVSALVSHLLRQGVYRAGDVAVLTPYLGQLSKLRHRLGSMMQIVVNDRDLNELADIGFAESSTEGTGKVGAHGAAKSSALQGVRVATVDNFQGEEARVVIVSCAAPCDWVPCTKRCRRTLACNHQCPSVCGETCPDKKYCQKCATDEIKSTVVDLIMFNDYRSVDLDEEPCIFPQCGHFLTYTTMDGQMRLGDVYGISPDGIPTAVKGDSHPFDLAKKVMVCPTCRGSLRNISRYGRIVRRGLLDESTKRFITWANSKWQELSVAFLSAQEKLQNTNKDSFVFPPDRRNGFDLRGARHEQIPALLGLTGHSRHKALRKVRSQTAHFLHQVKKDEQPYQRVAHLVWHINKKRKKDASFCFDESVIQMGSYLQAMALLLRCDLLLLSDFIDLCRSSKDPGAKSVTVEVASYLKDCEKLIQVAHTRNYVLQEVQGHIYIAMFCSFVKSPDETGVAAPDGQQQGLAEGNETQAPNQQAFHEEMKDLGLRHLDIARGLIEKHPSTAVLESECSAAHRMLNDGVFYSEVSNDEMRAVYQAMSREFSGTGHWYRCENGHPFTIGECGMAMQLARCPECGAPVGGQDHQSVAGVEHAHDIENLGTGVAGMRI
ncbi:NFX1-type zinc finger-containing protein 1 [Colletotrichum sidae]|uniref:NFX1-type zinc finger-containing protein 1 n=1 Tax=Colletotrichum sidae TaxID=1347389 RepID=A0A4R8T4W8_9PEZI|nr:NFX1-type zinc finger-containing protein 1 [Colletotrichum sidae]